MFRHICLALLLSVAPFASTLADTVTVMGFTDDAAFLALATNSNLTDARTKALAACQEKARSCRVLEVVTSGCYAVALSPGAFWTGKGPTLNTATAAARTKCFNQSPDCTIKITMCDAKAYAPHETALVCDNSTCDIPRSGRKNFDGITILSDPIRKEEPKPLAAAPTPQAPPPPTPLAQHKPTSYELFVQLLSRLKKDIGPAADAVFASPIYKAGATAFLGLLALGVSYELAKKYHLRERWQRFVYLDGPPPIPHEPELQTASFFTRVKARITSLNPLPARAPPTPEQGRAAQSALKLAHSLIFDHDQPYRALEDTSYAIDLLESSTLAAKQIAIAQSNDPTATFTDEEGKLFEPGALKAATLHMEAIARFNHNPKKSLKILKQAIAIAPHAAPFHYAYGNLALDSDYKGAIRALQQAVALEPENIDYEKTLLRAKNISKGERVIAGSFKIARKTYSTVRIIQRLFAWGLIIATGVNIYIQNWIGVAGCLTFLILMGLILKGKDKAAEWLDAHR
ncbi:MAG: DUF4189 domain-containing protein [Hyphomicrobium sp.]|uniref:DUF4189 domain-containing protein n=1 Tax=Hyphomicrobium sp. TaxID=82 RepID=UPI0013279903|nr:DUF4189 domain-containing protein [Hyphomicrobium sp.]KAB2943072.1 MAG: DUF4189 domain-containing protein [Hyphomicrobium sp.]MBZ0208947.1 DUF4189 domain-containing protein [Hyphomicrobium sp.]